MPTPLVLYSDGPGLPTGLARITRDLAGRLWEGRGVVGYDPRPRGRGVEWPSYRLTGLGSDGDWGAAEIQECWREYFGHDDGVLLSIWDPARAFALLGLQSDTRAFWGYFPVDAHNVQGSFGGPAREAVQCYDRVLAYGRWGSQVLATIRRPVQYLPHGPDPDVCRLAHAPDVAAEAERVLRAKPGSWVLGCVATNQPRKDLGLLRRHPSRAATPGRARPRLAAHRQLGARLVGLAARRRLRPQEARGGQPGPTRRGPGRLLQRLRGAVRAWAGGGVRLPASGIASVWNTCGLSRLCRGSRTEPPERLESSRVRVAVRRMLRTPATCRRFCRCRVRRYAGGGLEKGRGAAGAGVLP